ncbi:MAG: RibD family protein [Bacteroidota bacterium]
MDSLWQALLTLQTELSSHKAPFQWLSFTFGEAEPRWAADALVLPQDGERLIGVYWDKRPPLVGKNKSVCWVRSINMFTVQLDDPSLLSADLLPLLRDYLPYCLLPYHAHRQKRAISITHFAQSLDGRIATESGDSRWIGSEENLIHAHRMRALCDGILIGSQTLVADEPSLTTRHVKGSNPKRIVVGTSAHDFSSLWRSCPDPVLVLGNGKLSEDQRLEYVSRDKSQGRWRGIEILECLYERGICSVYIEGGAQTTSNFLHDGAVDILQLHFSPRLFGSGISSIKLPEIGEVKDSIKLDPFTFVPVGNSMMFVGQICDKA